MVEVPCEPRQSVGRLTSLVNDWYGFLSYSPAKRVQRRMRVLCMPLSKRSGRVAAAHVVERVLSEFNLAASDIQLRIAD